RRRGSRSTKRKHSRLRCALRDDLLDCSHAAPRPLLNPLSEPKEYVLLASRPRTLRELKQAGHHMRSVKDEMRVNLIARLRSGERLFPGIVGSAQRVEPQIVNAILSRHDFILLGLRGQAKTRILRALATFLDEWTPFIQ